ncbi:MAG: TonB-dependent receptor [Betaproteobacteria bacterium]|nr:TonB-dependent receptor [Betaproteobacteria bacterium]
MSYSTVAPRVRLLGIVLALHGAYAGAQQNTEVAQAPAANGELPQVVVTGSRFSEPVNAQTAIGTTVITADEIAKSGALTIYDALRQLGGVMTRMNLNSTLDAPIDLRGFGVTGDQNTLVLIDGVRVSENEQQPARLSSVPLNSIERIEILRGSGAVLYGSGATGGVVNVITKKSAEGSKNLNVGVLAGSYGTTNFSADGGIAGKPLVMLGGAALGADFAYNKYSSDNYRVNNGVEQENMSGRFRVIGEHGEAGVSVASERSHSLLPGSRSQTTYQTDPRGTTTPSDWADTDANRYTLYGNYRWQWVEIAADAFRRDKVDRFSSPGFFNRRGMGVEGFSPRVRVTAPLFGLENQFVVGYDRSRWALVGRQAGSEEGLSAAGLFQDMIGTQHNEAFYFKDDLNIGKIRLTLGARRETLKQSMIDPQSFPVTPFSTNDRKLHAEELGASWNFMPAWTVYGKVANSFRIGNIDDNSGRFPTPGFLLPQTSRDIDAGLAYTSRPFDAELHLFDSRLHDEIMFSPFVGGGGFGSNVNLPPTERSGFELTVKWRPRSDLDLSAFYTQVRARFRSGMTGSLDVTGKEVPIVPRQRATLQANWRITGVDTVNVGWQYIGSQIFDNDEGNTFGQRIPAYSTIDAKYTRRIGNVDLSVSGKNLGNKGYYDYGIASTSTPGNYNVYPERRRAVFVSAVAHF